MLLSNNPSATVRLQRNPNPGLYPWISWMTIWKFGSALVSDTAGQGWEQEQPQVLRV